MKNLYGKIKQEIEQYNETRREFPLSVSIGYASTAGGEALFDILKLADMNMYQEKRACRERVRQGLIQSLGD